MLRHLVTLTVFVVLWQKVVNGLGKILRRLLKFFFPSLLDQWDSWSDFRREFLRNVFVGLSVFFLITIFNDYPWFMDTEDAGIDLVMQIRQNIIQDRKSKEIPAFIFVDVDNVSRHQWNEPLITPRERIKNMIATAVQGGAKLVVVNYDFSRAVPVEAGAPLHSGDQALKDYLANYASEHCQADKVCPPILLVRTFEWSSDPVPKPRIGFLEEAVQQSNPYVQWGSAQFYLSSYDQHVRRWRLWEPVCVENKPTVIPSVELSAAALIRNQYPLTEGTPTLTPAQTQALLNKRLAEFQPANCQQEEESDLPRQIHIGDLTINTDKRGVFQRVMFGFSWPEDKDPGLDYFQYDESGDLALAILSAHNYAKLPVDTDISIFENNIVIIGTSSPQARDIYLTPLDEMPGAMIIINAIHSLLEYEVIKPMPLWARVLWMVILIFVMSWLFTVFDSFIGMILLGGLIIVVILPVAIALFRYGVWLDFALPLLVVQVYQMAVDFDEWRKQAQVQQQGKMENQVVLK